MSNNAFVRKHKIMIFHENFFNLHVSFNIFLHEQELESRILGLLRPLI